MYENAGIPVYLVLGFEGDGKTAYIKNLLNRDKTGTHLIVFEDGAEKYPHKNGVSEDTKTVFFYEKNIYPALFDDIAKSKLYGYTDTAGRPDRVIIEYNGMWNLDDLWQVSMPHNWEYLNVATVVDAEKFEMYLKDMYASLADKFSASHLIVFNRCNENTDMKMYMETAHGINPDAQIIFQGAENKNLPYIPYDINESEITIEDTGFSTFYADAMKNPGKYDGKTINIRGFIQPVKKYYPNTEHCKSNKCLFGRYVTRFGMFHFEFLNFFAEYNGTVSNSELYKMQMYKITAKIKSEKEKCKLYISKIESTEQLRHRVVYSES